MTLANLEFYRPIRVITPAEPSDYAGIPTVGALREHLSEMAARHGLARIEVGVGRDYFPAEIKTTSDLAVFQADLSQCAGFCVIKPESPDLPPIVEYVVFDFGCPIAIWY